MNKEKKAFLPQCKLLIGSLCKNITVSSSTVEVIFLVKYDLFSDLARVFLIYKWKYLKCNY